MIYCCKGCQKRYVGCHSQCKEYIEQHEEHLRQKKQAKKADDVRRYKNEGLRRYLDDMTKRKKNHTGTHYRYN